MCRKELKKGHLEASDDTALRIARALSANPAIAPQAFPDTLHNRIPL
jgi:hypothetical protein